MSAAATMLVEEYREALREFVEGHGEAALQRAYATGRRALAEGVGVLELVAALRVSLLDSLGGDGLSAPAAGPAQERLLCHALDCFTESLSPYEMVLRGAQEGTGRLQQSLSSLQSVEEQLRSQNEELTAAHRSVEKERSRYQTLFEFAPDGYLVTGLEGAIREANTAAAALLGTPRETLPGRSLHEFIVEADRAEFRERLHHLHAGTVDRIEDWQIFIQRRTGPPIPGALTVVAERSAPAISALRWLIRDDTERKRLERERARSLVGEARAEAARRFEFLAEASSLLVGSLDVEANLISVARLTVSYLAGWCFVNILEPDATLRQLEVAHADPALGDLAARLRRHCLLGHRIQKHNGMRRLDPQVIGSLTDEWWNEVADSAEHAALLRQLKGSSAMVLPLHIHDRLMGIVTLISARGARGYRAADRIFGEDLARCCALALENARLYRDVVAERDKAELANRAKDEFVAILAHELRNPLTPILGWTQALKDHSLMTQDAVVREGIEAMERNAKTLARLVSDCVDLTRISEGKIRVEYKAADLNEIIISSIEAIGATTATRGLRLALDLCSEPVPILGDSMRLEQVMNNLLINAVKYTDSGGLISVSSIVCGEEAEIAVRDTGIGIDPAFLDQIFQPFRQGTAAWLTSQSGLGLGLTITRQIVEMHGGRVWAESPGLGQGSTFRVRLRVSRKASEEVRPRSLASQKEGGNLGIRLLLVEDSQDILFLMKVELEKLGYAVATAQNGRAGIEAVRAHRPDLIVSDIKMPVMDGYEFIRVLRAAPEFHDIPAIALTGFGTQGTNERALTAGFNACVNKPPEREDLLAAIRQFTRKSSGVAASQSPGGGEVHRGETT